MTSSQDTADRSLAHWSEAGRAEMEAFYVLATEDYRQLAVAPTGPRCWPGAAASSTWRAAAASSRPRWPPTPGWPACLRSPTTCWTPRRSRSPRPVRVSRRRSRRRRPRDHAAGPARGRSDLRRGVGHPRARTPCRPRARRSPPSASSAALAPGGLGVVAQATTASHYLAFYEAYRAGVPRGATALHHRRAGARRPRRAPVPTCARS